jgi:hypothetical protein
VVSRAVLNWAQRAQRVAHVLMFKRVAWQAAAVLFVLLALLTNLR